MIVSLNEIAATTAKAVRGCGHPEGIAEEMGFAVRWLCERELPGLAAIRSALTDDAGSVGPSAGEPTINRDRRERIRLQAGGRVAALRFAPSLVELAVAGREHSTDLPPRCTVTAAAMSHPLLLVPFVDRARCDRVSARWSTADGPVVVERSEAGICIQAEPGTVLAAAVGRDVAVTVGPFEQESGLPVAVTANELVEAARRSVDGGCTVEKAEWKQLGDLAWRSYVPASAEARLRGAGPALDDDDG